MSTEHTPGPWHTANPHDEPYYEIWHGEIGEPDRECIAEYVRKANAAPIAAVPVLLKACEDVRAWGIELASLLPDERELRFRQLWPKVNDVLRDAIAEAEPSPPP